MQRPLLPTICKDARLMNEDRRNQRSWLAAYISNKSLRFFKHHLTNPPLRCQASNKAKQGRKSRAAASTQAVYRLPKRNSYGRLLSRVSHLGKVTKGKTPQPSNLRSFADGRWLAPLLLVKIKNNKGERACGKERGMERDQFGPGFPKS